MTRIYLQLVCLLLSLSVLAQSQTKTTKDDEQHLEGFQYYTALPQGSGSTTEDQTLANLDFFIWMQEEYGFRLGSYTIELTMLQDNLNTGRATEAQLEQIFPTHYQQIIDKAKRLQANIELVPATNNKSNKIPDEPNCTITSPTRNKRACNIQQNYDRKSNNTDGVSFSYDLDNWDDELILQVFNHRTNKMPRITGQPWFLKDSEFSKLGRINSLYEEYRKTLKRPLYLPDSYGVNAVSRGSKSKRLLTLTNMSRSPINVSVRLDEEIGLKEAKRVEIRSYHPTEKIIGYFPYTQIIELEVPPFRTILYYIGTPIEEDVTIRGLDYLLEKNNRKETQYRIMEPPVRARKSSIRLKKNFATYNINGKESNKKMVERYRTRLGRRSNSDPYHYRVAGSFTQGDVDAESEYLYEAAIFNTNNNALETRSLDRSGGSGIREVQKAQTAFLYNTPFIESDSWDKFLFDGDLTTAFAINKQNLKASDDANKCLRVDMKEETNLDEIKIVVEDEGDLFPQQIGETYTIETSLDLINWSTYEYTAELNSTIPITSSARYIRVPIAPNRILEFEGYGNEIKENNMMWSANNLYPHAKNKKPKKILKYQRRLRRIHANSYLCISLEGKHGIEGAYIAAAVDGKFLSFADRSPSYPSNIWQNKEVKTDSNYTYSLPLTYDMSYETIEIFLMFFEEDHQDVVPHVYMVSDDPFNNSTLQLIK